jgi:hypothetical protein
VAVDWEGELDSGAKACRKALSLIVGTVVSSAEDEIRR